MSVYVTRVYEFVCNAPGCESVSDQIIPNTETRSRRDAWREVKQVGWIEVDGRHYCPAHAGCG